METTTTDDKTVVATEEVTEPTAEELAKQDVENEAAFADGFNRVSGSEPDADADAAKKADQAALTADDAASATDASAAVVDATAAQPDPWEGVPAVVRERLDELGKLPGEVRRIFGSLGGLKSQLDTSMASAKAAAARTGGDAPTDKQITAALADPESWKTLMEDFPDFAGPVQKELQAMNARISAGGRAVDTGALTKQVVDQVTPAIQQSHARAREFSRIDSKYGDWDWESAIRSKEFDGWLSGQSTDMKALADSERARDAITLIDAFKGHQSKVVTGAQNRNKRSERLERATTPVGGAQQAGASAISDEQAFAAGFNAVAGSKK